MSHWVFILCTLFLLWVGSCLGIGPSSLNLALICLYFWFVGRLAFLPCHFVTSANLLLDLCLLGLFWACHALFSYSIHVIQYSCWVNSYTILGFLGPFHSFGHPRPALFLWASLAYFILTFSWAFATSFGLPRPNYNIFYFWGLLTFAPTPFTNSFLWAPTHFYLLSITYNSHGLTTFFSGLPCAHLFSLEPFLLFHRPVDHYSCHSGLMVFFLTLVILLPYSLLYCWASSCY